MARNVEESPFISFVNDLDYFSTSTARKHPRNERVTSAEELGTTSENNLREITLGIRSILRIKSLTSSFVVNDYWMSMREISIRTSTRKRSI